jgi:hypothetical protein
MRGGKLPIYQPRSFSPKILPTNIHISMSDTTKSSKRTEPPANKDSDSEDGVSLF